MRGNADRVHACVTRSRSMRACAVPSGSVFRLALVAACGCACASAEITGRFETDRVGGSALGLDLPEWFDEALTLRPLAFGGLVVHLNLTVGVDGRDWRHLELFPRAAAELALSTGALEVEAQLSVGRWLGGEWGVPPEPAPAGAAVWQHHCGVPGRTRRIE